MTLSPSYNASYVKTKAVLCLGAKLESGFDWKLYKHKLRSRKLGMLN